MKDARKERIRNLKAAIRNIQMQIKVSMTDTLVKQHQELNEELTLVRMNKYSSKFFEFIPFEGRNRRQRRQGIV